MSSLIGRAIGAYKVEKKIGEGGHSDVYLARDTINNRPVALKVLRLEHHSDRKKVERFWVGGHSARALEHKHIVPVYDAGLADSRYYIAMEYMAGRSVEDLLTEQGAALPWSTSVHYLDQVAKAIDYAHSRGVIHRDIKPSNILLSADRRNAYLTDFGIALLTGRETSTYSGTLVGTPEYISPEQIQGRSATARSDVYSLGITAYQMLSGRLPFDGPAVTVLYNHVHTPPPAIRRANRRLPVGITRPINKSLAKEPERRYATAGDFAHALRLAASGRSSPTLWAGLGGLALVIVLLAFVVPRLDPTTVPPVIATRFVTATPGDVIAGVETGVTSTLGSIVASTSTADPTAADPTTTIVGVTPSVEAASTDEAVSSDEATPSATPADAGAPRTLAPADGADISRGAAVQTFRWEWDRLPAADESFELRFYPEGSEEVRKPFGWHKENSAVVNLDNLPVGRYRWAVAVVRGTDGRWEADVSLSEPRDLIWGR